MGRPDPVWPIRTTPSVIRPHVGTVFPELEKAAKSDVQ